MRTTIKLGLMAELLLPSAVSAREGPIDCRDNEVGLDWLLIGENGEGVRSFYNGMVTLLRLDSEEPAAASAGLAILMPSGDGSDEPAFITCHAYRYFGAIDFDAMVAEYDPARGLTLTIPTSDPDFDSGGTVPGRPIRVMINAGNGTITPLD